MGKEPISSLREEYIKKLTIDKKIDKANRIIGLKSCEPMLNPLEMHPDSEIINEDINEYFHDIALDIESIDSQIDFTTNKFKNMLESTRARLRDIKRTLNTEKERQEDLSILCNKYTNFSNVISVSDKNSTGDYDFEKEVFSLKKKSVKPISITILDITGNGYEGNGWVYNNNEFISKKNDTSNREYIVDNNPLTFYEYSRITANKSERETIPQVNFDSIHSTCIISLKAREEINTIELESDIDTTIISKVSISNDGINYTDLDINNVAINNKKDRFNNSEYIYGSGLISFKRSKYVKITFKASENQKDNMAFIKKNANNTEEIIEMHSAKRSVIRINSLNAGVRMYDRVGKIELGNFISDKAKSVAIFANEYIASGYDIRKAVQYTLTINGEEYNVVPINSNYNGKKIIRTSNSSIAAEHVYYINEDAKNATLAINIRTSDDNISPFISNLKVLFGGF